MRRDYECVLCHGQDAAGVVETFSLEYSGSYLIGLCSKHIKSIICDCCSKKIFSPGDGDLVTGEFDEKIYCVECSHDGRVLECPICEDVYEKQSITCFIDEMGEEIVCCMDCKEEFD